MLHKAWRGRRENLFWQLRKVIFVGKDFRLLSVAEKTPKEAFIFLHTLKNSNKSTDKARIGERKGKKKSLRKKCFFNDFSYFFRFLHAQMRVLFVYSSNNEELWKTLLKLLWTVRVNRNRASSNNKSPSSRNGWFVSNAICANAWVTTGDDKNAPRQKPASKKKRNLLTQWKMVEGKSILLINIASFHSAAKWFRQNPLIIFSFIC